MEESGCGRAASPRFELLRGSRSFSASSLGSKVDVNGVFMLTTPGDFLSATHISTVAPAASQRLLRVGLQLSTKRET